MAHLFDPGTFMRPFRRRDFAIYMAGNTASMTGYWLQRMAMGWLVWQLTESASWLGIIAFVDLFPIVLVGFLAGTLADRWDRRHMIQVTQAIMLAVSIVITVLVVTGTVTIWLLFGLAVIQGFASAFNQPARLTLIGSLADRDQVGSAIAINSVVVNLSRFAGPAAGGILIASIGISSAFIVNALANAMFQIALHRIATPPLAARPAGKPTILKDMREGLGYAMRHDGIAFSLLLVIALSLSGRATLELLPGFADRVFSAGIGGLATMTAAMGIGATIGALWVAGAARRPTQMFRATLSQLLLMALFLMGFVATDELMLAVIALGMAGFGMSASGTLMLSTIQLAADPNMAGRAVGLFSQIFRGAPAFGALIMGFASEFFGLRWPVFVSTLLVVALVAWAWSRRERIFASLSRADRTPTVDS